MGLKSSHVHGAMAKVAIDGVVVGIWTTFSYSVAFDVVPSFILGRYTPAALTTTGVEPVAITAGGWRVVNNSFFKVGGIPDLKKKVPAVQKRGEQQEGNAEQVVGFPSTASTHYTEQSRKAYYCIRVGSVAVEKAKGNLSLWLGWHGQVNDAG